MRKPAYLVVAVLGVLLATSLVAQVAPPPAGQVTPVAPPPATKLEGFKPAAGSVVTIGYEEIGSSGGVEVDAKDMRDAKGAGARGMVVRVIGVGQYDRDGSSFVDADEIPELLRGLDALLDIKSNPTQFPNFEVHYRTRGDLDLAAFNNSSAKIGYLVKAGRTLPAQRFLGEQELRKLRSLFDAALQKLNATAGK